MSTTLSWIDGDYTVATAVSNPVLSQPFEGDSGEYVLTQDFWQFLANFSALPLNTPYTTLPFAGYYLVGESPLTDLGGGLCKWTRTYAQVPATRNDPSSLAYPFIGYYGRVANLATSSSFPVIGRPRQSLPVTCRIQSDYFLIGATPPASFTNISLIPVIAATKYYVPQGSIIGGVFAPTYAAGSTNDLATGTDTDFIWDPASFGGIIPTIPSRTTYQGWITAGTEVVAEASQLSRWKGNIYQRQTKYVIAR